MGTVRENIGANQFAKQIDICSLSRDSSNRRVIVILESPHIKEFEARTAPAPALGCTGTKLRAEWNNVFGDEFESYDLILMNAIQYQCSLGFSPIQPEIRDYVFKSMFSDDCQRSFQERFSRYHRDKDLVVLAATKNLKIILQQSMGDLPYAEVSHPSSWRTKKRIELAKMSFAQTYNSWHELSR